VGAASSPESIPTTHAEHAPPPFLGQHDDAVRAWLEVRAWLDEMDAEADRAAARHPR